MDRSALQDPRRPLERGLPDRWVPSLPVNPVDLTGHSDQRTHWDQMDPSVQSGPQIQS